MNLNFPLFTILSKSRVHPTFFSTSHLLNQSTFPMVYLLINFPFTPLNILFQQSYFSLFFQYVCTTREYLHLFFYSLLLSLHTALIYPFGILDFSFSLHTTVSLGNQIQVIYIQESRQPPYSHFHFYFVTAFI